MYENIFNRQEEKYLLIKEKKEELLRKINKYIEKDKFYEATICNIYFDTKNKDLVIHSLEKPMYKDKVRLRSYNVPNLDSTVFLEMKTKYRGIVNKRRVKLCLKDFYNYMNKKKIYKNSQIMKELDYLFCFYNLVPAYFIAYDRQSYVGKENKDLRITIDANLRSRKEDLHLELGDAGKKYFKEDKYIMEIKTLNALPLWMSHILSELHIFPISFSKYGSIYSKDVEECLC